MSSGCRTCCSKTTRIEDHLIYMQVVFTSATLPPEPAKDCSEVFDPELSNVIAVLACATS